MKDYYKILEVDEDATPEDIKKSFRQKALKIHPDKSGRDTTTEFIELFEAYNILTDRANREKYNKKGNSDAQKAEDELTPAIVAIQSAGVSYAKDFNRFDQEVLKKILLDLLFVFDKLVFASVVAVIVGLATIVKGLAYLDIVYSIVGMVIVSLGLFFGKLKIDNIKYFEKTYRSKSK